LSSRWSEIPPITISHVRREGAGYVVSRLPKWSYTLWANFKQPTEFGFISANLNWRWVGGQSIGEGRRGPEAGRRASP
jgi:hypothetical protein